MSENDNSLSPVCSKCGEILTLLDDTANDNDNSNGTLLESFVVVSQGSGSGSDSRTFWDAHSPICGTSNTNSHIYTGAQNDAHKNGRVLANIIELANSDHSLLTPMCEKCADALMSEIKKQTDELEAQNELYTQALTRLQNEEPKFISVEEEECKKHIQKLHEEEKALTATLISLTSDLQSVDIELSEVNRRLDEAEAEEDRLFSSYLEHQCNLLESEEEIAATNSIIQYSSTQLSRLKRLNVISDTFHIWYDGDIGTINGFRLGRTHEITVPLEEVNVAWGQVCLLLEIIVKKRCFTLSQFRLLPRGSYSSIIKVSDQTQYPLYCMEGFLRQVISGRKYDYAMVAILHCVEEIIRQITASKITEIMFPWKIEGERIGGMSIRLQFNSEENWTKALKYLLTDIKWIVSYLEGNESD